MTFWRRSHGVSQPLLKQKYRIRISIEALPHPVPRAPGWPARRPCARGWRTSGQTYRPGSPSGPRLICTWQQRGSSLPRCWQCRDAAHAPRSVAQCDERGPELASPAAKKRGTEKQKQNDYGIEWCCELWEDGGRIKPVQKEDFAERNWKPWISPGCPRTWWGFQSLSKMMTVSADCRLSPKPPALVLSRNTKYWNAGSLKFLSSMPRSSALVVPIYTDLKIILSYQLLQDKQIPYPNNTSKEKLTIQTQVFKITVGKIVLHDGHERSHLTEEQHFVVGCTQLGKNAVQELELSRGTIQVWPGEKVMQKIQRKI